MQLRYMKTLLNPQVSVCICDLKWYWGLNTEFTRLLFWNSWHLSETRITKDDGIYKHYKNISSFILKISICLTQCFGF